MPTYRIKIDGSTYRVNSPQELTDEQAYSMVAGQHEQYKAQHDEAVQADQQAQREAFAQSEKERPLQERVRANLGAGFHRAVQGVGGLLGLTDEADVAEHKKLREQLAEGTQGGQLLQIAGEVLPTLAVPAGAGGQLAARAAGAIRPAAGQMLTRALASRVGNVANIAGTGALMTAATTPGDLTDRAVAGGLAAGAGAALPGAVAMAQGARRVVAPGGARLAAGERFLSELEQEAPGRADQMVAALTQHGPTRQTLAGVQRPTAAQLTGDPVLRELEVGARTKQGAAFAAGDEAAAQGRFDVLHDIAKGPQELATAEAARKAATAPMRDAALAAAGKTQGFETPVLQTAKMIAGGEARPNPAVQTMTNYVINQIEQGVTPAQLYTLRKTLTNGVPHGTELGAAITQARGERMALVKSIDEALDNATGGQWTPYLQKFQELSQPVTSMKAGQAIERDFASAANTTARGDPVLTTSKLRGAIQARGQKQFGGQMKPRITDAERARLDAVADSLESATKARMSQGLEGSRTAGNIAAGDNVSAISAGLGHLVGGVPGAAVAKVLPKWHGARSERILAELLQDPEKLAQLIQKAQGAQAVTQRVGETARVGRALGELGE